MDKPRVLGIDYAEAISDDVLPNLEINEMVGVDNHAINLGKSLLGNDIGRERLYNNAKGITSEGIEFDKLVSYSDQPKVITIGETTKNIYV